METGLDTMKSPGLEILSLQRPLKRKRVRCSGSDIFSRAAWAELGRSLRLSGRELQIIRGIFDDLTEFAIASELGISCHTVHTHVERLHRKMDVRDRVELLLRVMCEFISLTAAAESTLPPICARRAAGRCPLRD